MKLYPCSYCQAWVDPALGAVAPVEGQGRAGTVEDPKAPGDHVACCDECCYGDGRCQAPENEQERES